MIANTNFFTAERENFRSVNRSNVLFLAFSLLCLLCLTKISAAKDLELISAEMVYQNSNLNLGNFSLDQNMNVVSAEGVTEVFSPGEMSDYPWRETHIKHYYISDPDNAKIVVDYSNVGTYKGKSIDCRVTISGIVNFYGATCSGCKLPAIQLPSRIQQGIWTHNTYYLTYEYVFFYSGTSAAEAIDIENSLWIFFNITMGEKIVYLNNPEQTAFVYDPSQVFVDTTNYNGTDYSSLNSTMSYTTLTQENKTEAGAAFPISGTSQKFLLDLTEDEELYFAESAIGCLIQLNGALTDYPLASFYSVSTSVTNGSITPSDEEVKQNTTKTINYSPFPGYKLESIIVDGISVNIDDYPNMYNFVNITSSHDIVVTYILDLKTITVSKAWTDQDNKYKIRPTSITFDAFPGNSNISAGNCTVSISNSWSCTINNLPIYDNSGNEIQYVIKERNAPKAYAADPVTVPSGRESVSITNKLVTKNIEISKKWVGDRDNLFNTRPQQITFDAYWNNTVYGSCSAKAQDNWKCSIGNLAVYDGSGAAITYTIKERNVPKAYTADEPVISGENNKTGTLTNTLITKDVSVNKAWEDQNNKYGGRPTNLKFDLYLGNEVKDSCTATPNTSWKCTFSGLPVYDALGLEQKYVVKENTVPVGYTTKDTVVAGKDTKIASITNKLITRDITAIKNWTDNNDHDRKRPQSIVLKLYQDNELFSTAALTAAENTLSENVWTYIFKDIPKYNKDGEEAVYSVKEFPAN